MAIDSPTRFAGVENHHICVESIKSRVHSKKSLGTAESLNKKAIQSISPWCAAVIVSRKNPAVDVTVRSDLIYAVRSKLEDEEVFVVEGKHLWGFIHGCVSV